MGIDNVKDPEKEKYAAPPQMSEKTALKNESKPQEANLATSELQVKPDPTSDVPGSPETAQPAEMSMEDKVMAIEKAIQTLTNQVSLMQEAWDAMAKDPDEESADAGLKQAAQYAKDENVPESKESPKEEMKETPKEEKMEAMHSKELSELKKEIEGLRSEVAQFASSGIKKTVQSMRMKVVDADEAGIDEFFKKRNI